MDMNVKIELFERTQDEHAQYLIAECNKYDSQNNRIEQCSRSPFSFPLDWTDEVIIQHIASTDYAKYF